MREVVAMMVAVGGNYTLICVVISLAYILVLLRYSQYNVR